LALTTDILAVGLIVATLVLAYFTLRLVDATHELNRTQILPRLVCEKVYKIDNVRNIDRIEFRLWNMGNGVAFLTKSALTKADGTTIDIRQHGDAKTIDARGEATYLIDGVKRGERIELVFEYEDVRGHRYEPIVCVRTVE